MSNSIEKTGKPANEHFPQTITDELFEAWTISRRREDVKALTAILGVTATTIYRALIYGHVNQQAIIDGINKFFKDRITSEKKVANDLKKGAANAA